MKKPSPRHKARYFTVQALYQWQMAGTDYDTIIQHFFETCSMKRVDDDYFKELLCEVMSNSANLDALFEPLLDRPLKEVDAIELAVLRIASHELAHCPNIPYRAVLNEALELVKTFGSVDGYKFINGVLDPLAKQLRKEEIAATPNK